MINPQEYSAAVQDRIAFHYALKKMIPLCACCNCRASSVRVTDQIEDSVTVEVKCHGSTETRTFEIADLFTPEWSPTPSFGAEAAWL